MKTSQELAELAKQHAADAKTLRQALPKAYEALAGLIVAAVAAKVYETAADMLELLVAERIKAPTGGAAEAARALVARNQELRKAAIYGDWDRFAKLASNAEPDADAEPVRKPAGD